MTSLLIAVRLSIRTLPIIRICSCNSQIELFEREKYVFVLVIALNRHESVSGIVHVKNHIIHWEKGEKNRSFIDFDASPACLVLFFSSISSTNHTLLFYSAACRLPWTLRLAIHSFCVPALLFQFSSSLFHFQLPILNSGVCCDHGLQRVFFPFFFGKGRIPKLLF